MTATEVNIISISLKIDILSLQRDVLPATSSNQIKSNGLNS